MLKEIEYRTFDQLLDSVKLDFETYDIENMISNQTLIKVAQRVNSQLGLKIHPSKTKVLELVGGRAKLPSDLKVLNFVLLCGEESSYDVITFPQAYGTYTQGYEDGIRQGESDLSAKMVKQYTEIVDIVVGSNIINHNLGTNSVVVQTYSPLGVLLTFTTTVINTNQINITSLSDLSNIKIIVLGSNSSYGVYCPPVTNPLCPLEPEIIPVDVPVCPTLTCNPGGCDTVAYSTNNKLKTYKVLTQLRLLTNKSTTVDEFNVTSSQTDYATLKNGYLVTNLDDAIVFINYQGQMEDEEGNLLVLDHDIVNEYYEYSLKERICENLIVSGEQVQNLYNLIASKLPKARQDALSYVRTPNFKDLYRIWKMNRKAMYIKYYNPYMS